MISLRQRVRFIACNHDGVMLGPEQRDQLMRKNGNRADETRRDVGGCSMCQTCDAIAPN